MSKVPKNKQSTRYFSSRQENSVANNIGGRTTSNSGASNRIELKPHDMFGYLEVIKLSDKRTKDGRRLYECFCHGCNSITYVLAKDLIRGHNKSCGCKNLAISNKHGYVGTRIYRIWQNMKNRCRNKNIWQYKYYGGRGITYCERWEDFLNFKEDMYKSYLEHVKQYGEKNTSLDRIDVNGNYCKENCRWATNEEQANNTNQNHYITYNGETHTLKEWSEIVGIDYSTLKKRIYLHKWDDIKALTTKVKNNGKKGNN